MRGSSISRFEISFPIPEVYLRNCKLRFREGLLRIKTDLSHGPPKLCVSQTRLLLRRVDNNEILNWIGHLAMPTYLPTYLLWIYLHTYLPIADLPTYVPTYCRSTYLPTYCRSTYLPTYCRSTYLPTYCRSTYIPAYLLEIYLPIADLPTYCRSTYLATYLLQIYRQIDVRN